MLETKSKKNGSIKFSDFFGCYFVIYNDKELQKTITKRCGSEQEARDFIRTLNQKKEKELPNYWYND